MNEEKSIAPPGAHGDAPEKEAHAPEPWRLYVGATGHPERLEWAEFGLTICTFQEWDNPEWQMANARLIAAAPALADALEALLGFVGGMKDESGPDDYGDHVEYAQARSALRAAGRQPAAGAPETPVAEGEKVVSGAPHGSFDLTNESNAARIYEALAAAESRGRAEEREACARVGELEALKIKNEHTCNIIGGPACVACGAAAALFAWVAAIRARAPALTPSDPEKGAAK